MLPDLFHLVVDKAEYLDDTVFGGHKDLVMRESVFVLLS